MRNLKKILAMVLALVMSLSLMATASAADFKDASSINDTFETAVEVLSGLGVFNGYKEDGTFRPQGAITRAETAAIIYRIATGDVDDKQVSIYADYNLFTDVPSTAWYAGYVNFCANAEYIKGRGNGKFDPQGQVTGYEALAMILRAIGYTANGSFTGPDWAVQTARTAESRKITKNIVTGTLGNPATRESVAEILFRAILVNMVDHNVLHTLNGEQGYTETDHSLGYKTFGLEELVGVVMANEFANLETTVVDNQVVDNGIVLDQGKTDILVDGEKAVRTLNITTKITDIGESRLVYTQNTAKVLSIADTGVNKTTQYGKGIDVSNSAKFASVAEMSQNADTKFYINFDISGYHTSNFRLEYEYQFSGDADDYDTQAEKDAFNPDAPANTESLTYNAGIWTYHRVIPAKTKITQVDESIMRAIFTWSNGKVTNDDKTTVAFYSGKVFVGTQTGIDISDDKTVSYTSFCNSYYNNWIEENWQTSDNGDWVKFIDNDGDGVCDYALYTWYYLDEALSTYTKDNATIIQYNRFTDDDDHNHYYHSNNVDDWYTVRYMNGDEAIDRNVAVGDIVLAAEIDNQVLVSKPETVTTKANSYDYKTETITAANGQSYTQSYIGNFTGLQRLLASMIPNTEYEMFLDKFGFVRAYRPTAGNQYALVTEIYAKNNNQGNLIQNWPMTVELVMPENGKAVAHEYNLVQGSQSALVAGAPWTYTKNAVQTSDLYNWLQPAISGLGAGWTGLEAYRKVPNLSTNAPVTYWPRSGQMIREISSFNDSTEFRYGKQYYTGNIDTNRGNKVPEDLTTSFTNVALVSIDGTNASVYGAAKAKLSTAGQPVLGTSSAPQNYSVNYIQLSTADVAKSAARYAVGGAADYRNAYNNTINADENTEIYVVYDGGVKYFKGYTNMPALNEKTVGEIHAAYAVARNTDTGTGTTVGTGSNYWIADVIVYEVKTWSDLNTSISLAYYVPYQTIATATRVTVDTLNNGTNPAKVQLIPADMAWDTTNNWWNNNIWYWNVWASDYNGYGFYLLHNPSAANEGVMTASSIDWIGEKYADHGIYAGIVAREVDLASTGYIPVNLSGKKDDSGRLKVEAQISISTDKVYSITTEKDPTSTAYNNPYEANNLWYNNTKWSGVKANDQIIWVGGASTGTTVSSASFIVDLGSNTNGNNDKVDNTDLWVKTGSWLKTLWNRIHTDYINTNPNADKVEITIKWITNTLDIPNSTFGERTEWIDKNAPWYIKASDLQRDGYTINSVSARKTAKNDNGVVVTMINGGSVISDLDMYGITTASLDNKDTTVYVLCAKILADDYSVAVKGTSDNVDEHVYITHTELSNGTNGTTKEVPEDITLRNGVASTPTALKSKGLQMNSSFTITTYAPAAGTKLTASATVYGKTVSLDIERAANGALTITGTVTGPVEVTIGETAITNTITVEANKDDVTGIAMTGATSVSYDATTGKATGDTTWGGDVTINVTPATGKQLMASSVRVTVDGTAVPATAYTVSTNQIILKNTSADLQYKDVLVTFDTETAMYTVRAKSAGSAASATANGVWNGTVSIGTSSDYKNPSNQLAGTTLVGNTGNQAYANVAHGGTLYVNITGNDNEGSPTVTLADPTSGTISDAVPTGGAGGKTWQCVITNISSNVTVVVETPKTGV